ncbi:MAG: ABC transporter permease, partial [Myxococcota bacterium]|nr:ABC transporter permease [Myxococcota bacterium]
MGAALQRLFLPAFVALRLVRSRRSKRLSTVTLVSMVGVAFGVMALTIVLGVTSGFQEAFQARILGLYPHIVLLKRSGDFRGYDQALDDIRAVPGVTAATPATYDDMMMAAGVQRAGAVIKGIDIDTVKASPMLWDPIRYLDTCPSSDGAVALVLSDADAAAKAPT